jgi:hypothetical protein
MSESSSEDEFDPKYFFPNFRSEISTESESQAATVVGFDKEELLFTPIIGGHLNFTSTEDDDYPVCLPRFFYLSFLFIVTFIIRIYLCFCSSFSGANHITLAEIFVSLRALLR